MCIFQTRSSLTSTNHLGLYISYPSFIHSSVLSDEISLNPNQVTEAHVALHQCRFFLFSLLCTFWKTITIQFFNEHVQTRYVSFLLACFPSAG